MQDHPRSRGGEAPVFVAADEKENETGREIAENESELPLETLLNQWAVQRELN